MATKADKKNAIRQDIIDSAGIYSQNLAGKAFLYVYGEEFFEVSFPVDHFLHLTGVETKLSAKDFYKNAKKAKLTNSQFYFDARHPYANARKKLPCLKRLPELTNDMVCILKDMQTVTIIYKLSVTNLEFTLGLTENTDANGNKINDFFLPMSLRVEDSSVEKSKDGEIVDFIFSKDASIAKYDTLLVEDKNKMSVTYQTVDENARLVGYETDFKTMKKQITDALNMGENVIIGYTQVDASGTIINGHEITITGTKTDKNGKMIIVCNDTDDNVPRAVEYSEDFLLPKIHHAALPQAVVANDVNFVENWVEGLKTYKDLKRQANSVVSQSQVPIQQPQQIQPQPIVLERNNIGQVA